MTHSKERWVTVTFECPACKKTVEMTESANHRFTTDGENHKMTFRGTPEKDCPVYFRNEEESIRRDYDFINTEVPTIFVTVPEMVTDQELLESLINAPVTHGLGVTIRVTKRNRDNERTGYGEAHGWYHAPQDAYYGVVRGLYTPHNVIVTGSREEFAEFMEKWYYHDREYDKPDTEYSEYRPDGENRSIEDF